MILIEQQMPLSCDICPFYNSKENMCHITKTVKKYNLNIYKEKMKNCPLKEVKNESSIC